MRKARSTDKERKSQAMNVLINASLKLVPCLITDKRYTFLSHPPSLLL